MEERELDLLADLIAREILERNESPRVQKQPRVTPPRRSPPLVPPIWNQPLKAIAPPMESALAAREAAARRGLVEVAPRNGRRLRPRALDPQLREVPVGVSQRYVLLSDTDWRKLFGGARPTVWRELRQPGQVAYRETVRVVGPRGELDGVRVLGPFRERSRVGLARSLASRLGIGAPVRLPGDFTGAPTVTLVGPQGSTSAAAVVPASHVHLSSEMATALGIAEGDRVSLRCGENARSVTFHNVRAYIGEAHRPELHLDADEANAAGVRTGDPARLVDLAPTPASGRPAGAPRRALLTEQGVDAVAARGETLSAHSPYLITPAARDRARYLGIWRDS